MAADRYTVSDHFGDNATSVTLVFEHSNYGPIYPDVKAGAVAAVKEYFRSKDPESGQVTAKAYTTVVTDA
ncbi:hypothetical protein [Streptomyces chryseus]